MEVVAVVQLDRLLRQTKKLDEKQSIQVIHEQVTLLMQCHKINKWIFTATPQYSSRLPLQLQASLGIKLIVELNSDPLTEFYQVARSGQDQPKLNKAGLDPVVVRLIPGWEKPQYEIVDAMIENHLYQGHHYSRSRDTDDGNRLFVEIMNFSVLDEAWREAILPDDRLYITPYIYRQQQRLNVGYFPPAELTSISA